MKKPDLVKLSRLHGEMGVIIAETQAYMDHVEGQPEPIEPPPTEPSIITNLGETLGLSGPNDKGDQTIRPWSRFNGKYIKYVGCPECDRGIAVYQNAVHEAAKYNDCLIQVGDGNQPPLGDCKILHRGNHPAFGSSFDIDIPLNVIGETRDWAYDGRELVTLWNGPFLLTSKIDWDSTYHVLTDIHKFAQQSAWKCLVYSKIRNYVLREVKRVYGKAAADQFALIIHADPQGDHKYHIHITLGKIGVYDQKFWGVVLGEI